MKSAEQANQLSGRPLRCFEYSIRKGIVERCRCLCFRSGLVVEGWAPGLMRIGSALALVVEIAVPAVDSVVTKQTAGYCIKGVRFLKNYLLVRQSWFLGGH